MYLFVGLMCVPIRLNWLITCYVAFDKFDSSRGLKWNFITKNAFSRKEKKNFTISQVSCWNEKKKKREERNVIPKPSLEIWIETCDEVKPNLTREILIMKPTLLRLPQSLLVFNIMSGRGKSMSNNVPFFFPLGKFLSRSFEKFSRL